MARQRSGLVPFQGLLQGLRNFGQNITRLLGGQGGQRRPGTPIPVQGPPRGSNQPVTRLPVLGIPDRQPFGTKIPPTQIPPGSQRGIPVRGSRRGGLSPVSRVGGAGRPGDVSRRAAVGPPGLTLQTPTGPQSIGPELTGGGGAFPPFVTIGMQGTGVVRATGTGGLFDPSDGSAPGAVAIPTNTAFGLAVFNLFEEFQKDPGKAIDTFRALGIDPRDGRALHGILFQRFTLAESMSGGVPERAINLFLDLLEQDVLGLNEGEGGAFRGGAPPPPGGGLPSVEELQELSGDVPGATPIDLFTPVLDPRLFPSEDEFRFF